MARIDGPRRPWRDRKVVLGVTGGIAAYKTVQLARDLTRLGAIVDVVLSSGAQHFVKPLSFEALTGRTVLSDLFSTDGAAQHIRLGQDADVVCVAPATADFMARAAHGRADDLLTTTLLAATAPVLVCPAMNDVMFRHPQTMANLAHLRDVLGYAIAGPGTGPLAHGEGEGAGRMLEPSEIIEHIGRALAAGSRLEGRNVVITAGPTREAVDPVRYVGNRSSGRMGFALAEAAWRRGAIVTLVTGPTNLGVHAGVRRIDVESATEMRDAVLDRAADADVLAFAAAVSDYRPSRPAGQKLKRAQAGAPVIETVENPDVALESMPRRRENAVVVGFALETEELEGNARAKMTRKGFDLVVANPASEEAAGFESDTNRAIMLGADGTRTELPLMSKNDMAEEILDAVVARLS